MADKGPLLVTDGLTKVFDQAHAVDNVSLGIPAGQFVGVIGRSGAGKSTLLRLINRLTDPSTGRILCGEIEVTALRGRKLRVWRRRCAMIFQQFNLVGRLDVLNNVLMGRLAYAPAWQSLPKLWSREDKIMAMAALDQFGLAELAAQRAESLSGGQQQRVAICRALLQEPEIVLADEPVASLDPENTRIVMEALRRINRHFGVTVLCNLHSVELARSFCDRLVGMAAGRVVFDGAPSTLTQRASRELYGMDTKIVPNEAERGFAGAAAGALAIMSSDIGAFGKLMSEAIEAVDRRPVDGVLSAGGSRLHAIRFGVMPQVLPVFASQVLYFFESNTRSATIIGIVGAGGIGLQLSEQIRVLEWQQVSFLILMILVTVAALDWISQRLRSAMIGHHQPS